MKKLVLLLLVLLLPVSAFSAAPESLDRAGLDSLLANNRGKVIMLNFFATWCPPCRAEIPEIVKMRKAFPQDKLLVVGLSVDADTAAVAPFMARHGMDYPVYLAQPSITDAYNVSSVPHNVFIARDGSLVISEPGMADANVLDQVVRDLLK